MKVPVLNTQNKRSQMIPLQHIWNEESALKLKTALNFIDIQETKYIFSDDASS